MEVVLVPQAVLLLRHGRLHRGGDVLNVVAATRHQPAHAFRPQRGHDAGGSSAPIKTDKDRVRETNGIKEVEQVLAQRGLLT